MSIREEAMICDICLKVIESDHHRFKTEEIGGKLDGEKEDEWDFCSNCFNNKIRCVLSSDDAKERSSENANSKGEK